MTWGFLRHLFKPFLPKGITLLFLSLGMGLFAQNTPGSSLREFEQLSEPLDRFEFFLETENRYVENTGSDWLERIDIYLDAAREIRDSSSIRIYSTLRARIYTDLDEYSKSIKIGQLLLKDESLNTSCLAELLRVMDQNYGQLNLFNKQLEIRERQKQLGFEKETVFHDLYEKLGLYKQARNSYILHAKAKADAGTLLDKAAYLNQLGHYRRLDGSPGALDDFEQAKKALNDYVSASKSITPREIQEIDILKAEIEGNIGKTHILLGDLSSAITSLERSLKDFRKLGRRVKKDLQTENALYLAKALMDVQRLSSAYPYLSERRYGKGGIRLELMRNRLLARYFDNKEDPITANRYYKRNQQISDSVVAAQQVLMDRQYVSLFGEAQEKGFSELSTKYRQIGEQNEQNRASAENAQLQLKFLIISLVFILIGFAGLVYAYLKSIQNQKVIEEQKQVIESSLKEKESLLKEIHHRVKNNLQMVSSLLSLQTKNTRDKSAIQALEEGKSRVKAMALIHQKLYQNEDLSVVEMQGYIESLINSIQAVYKKGGHNIDISVDARGTELDIDQAIPIGLILNELVSNSFKYAFPHGDEEARIYIHLQKEGGQGHFEYTDNGIGLPEDTAERTKSSMGIRLVNRLVNQLQSKLNVDNKVNGVRFWFNF